VRSGVERAVQATETMVEGVDNAGIPDTEQGVQSAEQVSSWANGALNALEQAEDSLEEEAETLEDAVEQVTGALGTLGSVVASGVQTIADVARDDPELAGALDASSTCGELREGTGA
jgi:ABC-type transporter Mla subunit MlaD